MLLTMSPVRDERVRGAGPAVTWRGDIVRGVARGGAQVLVVDGPCGDEVGGTVMRRERR